MSFLKGKTVAGDNILIAVSQIQSVVAAGEGTTITLVDGDTVYLEFGFQAVSNRLKELAEIA